MEPVNKLIEQAQEYITEYGNEVAAQVVYMEETSAGNCWFDCKIPIINLLRVILDPPL